MGVELLVVSVLATPLNPPQIPVGSLLEHLPISQRRIKRIRPPLVSLLEPKSSQVIMEQPLAAFLSVISLLNLPVISQQLLGAFHLVINQLNLPVINQPQEVSLLEPRQQKLKQINLPRVHFP